MSDIQRRVSIPHIRSEKFKCHHSGGSCPHFPMQQLKPLEFNVPCEHVRSTQTNTSAEWGCRDLQSSFLLRVGVHIRIVSLILYVMLGTACARLCFPFFSFSLWDRLRSVWEQTEIEKKRSRSNKDCLSSRFLSHPSSCHQDCVAGAVLARAPL